MNFRDDKAFNDLYDTILAAPPEEISPEVVEELKAIREDFTVDKFATITSKYIDTPHLSPFARVVMETTLGLLRSYKANTQNSD